MRTRIAALAAGIALITPGTLLADTIGDLGYDVVFGANGSLARFQNLGNGSFAGGKTVSGFDFVASTSAGNLIKGNIREHLPTGELVNDYLPAYMPTVNGEQIYHFDLPTPFVPDPGRCYSLLMYEFSSAPNASVFGHSGDVYQASSSNCYLGHQSDDRASMIEHPALSGHGLTDYSFLIYLQGASSTPTTTPVCIENCNSSVLFIPGFQASRLYSTDGGETKLWEPGILTDTQELAMHEDGSSIQSDIYTRDVIDTAYIPGKGNIYASFVADMDELVANDAIEAWQAVPYDWRLSLSEVISKGKVSGTGISYLESTSTPYIEQTLRQLAADSRTGKVTIVAHSNGGLVAKALMQMLGDAETANLIDTVIFVAVPQLGTPQAVAALLHGEDQGLPVEFAQATLTEAEARELANNMPGAYTLLPSNAYFTAVDDPVITIDDETLAEWTSSYGDVIHSVELMGGFMNDVSRPTPALDDTQTPEITNSALFAQAQQLHDSLDSWKPPEEIKVIQIAGWGIPKTVRGIEYESVLYCPDTCEEIINFTASTTIDGDGTVVTPSALWLEAESNETLFLNLGLYNERFIVQNLLGLYPFKHANILEVDNLREYLRDYLVNEIRPLSEYVYLLPEAPILETQRIRYELHSPLTIDLFDAQGRHTGVNEVTGEIDEQIPGTYYTELGDVKYLYTDVTVPVRIEMDGYATGTFTFIAEELTGDTPVSATTFRDIPVTPETVVTMQTTAGISSMSAMQLDLNGDGSAEFSLPPVLNGETTLPNYLWDGFLQPINDPAANPNLAPSVFKGGSTVPVKFKLRDIFGATTTATELPEWLPPVRLGAMSVSVNESAPVEISSSGGAFRYDEHAQQYVYNWSTKGLMKGYWYKISAKLDDDSGGSVVVGIR